MITVYYHPQTNINAMGTFQVKEFTENIINEYLLGMEIIIRVSNELVIHSLVYQMLKNKLNYEKLQVHFGPHILYLDNEYNFTEYPEGFLDVSANTAYLFLKEKIKLLDKEDKHEN